LSFCVFEVQIFVNIIGLFELLSRLSICLWLLFRTDWASAKVLLGDSNFLKRLYEYDKDNIPDAMLKKLKKYIENPKFVPDAVEKVSKVHCLHYLYPSIC